MFNVELLKLKRSSVWVIAIILPMLTVVTGGINYWLNQDMLDSGWASLFGQVLMFYSLIFFAMGISILTAAAWRMEHQGTNWNLLRTHCSSSLKLMLAKTGAILVVVLAMQLMLFTGAVIFGFAVGAGGSTFPLNYLGTMLIAVVVAIPLVALQSLLSALMKSFAAPVALCFVGCIVGFLASGAPGFLGYLGYVIPQSMIFKVLSLGSAAVSGAGSLSWGTVLPLLASTVATSIVIFVLSTKLVPMTAR